MFHRLTSLPRRLTPVASLAALCVLLGAAPLRAADKVDFSRDIRPLLSDRCFACHGPGEEEREGGFRFDVKASVFGEADSGQRPIVPHKPDESELIARITSTDADVVMPPPAATKPLTAEEVELFRRWIEQGADWEGHWSLIVPVQSKLPKVKQSDWVKNPIDQFILARLEKEGLQPSPQANKETLIRRVTFDLTGLPPTLAEIDAFLADHSPEAYENLVNRLLETEGYGEHMARFWLDAARYGDTHGLHLDNYREIWPYRDWVINALNSNMPYDQFTTEQLAGDLLPNPTLNQIIATGFDRAHVTTSEGGSIAEEVYVRNVVDRVVTTGTVFMGLTMDCTRCHNHKFDPITMRDFYAMFAMFNSLDGNPLDGNKKDPAPVVKVPSESQKQQLADYDAQIAQIEKQLREPWPEVDALQQTWETELLAAFKAAEAETAEVKSSALTLGDWYAVGPFNDTKNYLFSRKHGPEGKPIKLDEEFAVGAGEKGKWIRHPEWADGKPHQGLPGQVAANFLYRSLTSPKAQKITVSFGSDDALKVFLNGQQVLAKNVSRGVAADQDVIELALKKGENQLLLKVINHGGATGFYFALKSAEASLPKEVVAAVRVAAAKRSAEQQQQLRDHFRNKVSEAKPLKAAQAALAKARKGRAAVDRQIPTTLIFRETKKPKEAYILTRGQYDQKGDKVARGTPVALPPMNPEWPVNRLGFAKWLVDRRHPLTARVAVNRYWQQVFGVGIVKTAEDFGSQGAPPSHPALLDWLAVQFMDDGWDIKETMKRIVLSATYRQSSRVTPELFKRDPENRLYAHGPRFRLDAEMIRDQALAVSGLLINKLGGPSVKPPQPDGLWFSVGYSGSNTVRFVADKGADKVHRRTLYTFVKRTSPPPEMSTFDGPSREACTVRRERTNTPLQALLLFNDPQFVEAARALAVRAFQEGGQTDNAKAAMMFRLCTGRQPTDQEVQETVQAVHEDRAAFEKNIPAAVALVSGKKVAAKKDASGKNVASKDVASKDAAAKNAPDSKHTAELAAWTIAASVMLNMDEVITKN